MVVDGQSQQIIIEQGGIAYQGQQIQPAQVTTHCFFIMYYKNCYFGIINY